MDVFLEHWPTMEGRFGNGTGIMVSGSCLTPLGLGRLQELVEALPSGLPVI